MTDKTEILGSQTIATGGPFKISMSVMLVGEGGQYEGYDAWAEIDLPPGKVPTQEQLEERLWHAVQQEGFRLATRKEFVESLLAERTGVSLSIPGPEEFELSPREPAEAGQ